MICLFLAFSYRDHYKRYVSGKEVCANKQKFDFNNNHTENLNFKYTKLALDSKEQVKILNFDSVDEFWVRRMCDV
jgi:hypothetical protein